MMHLHENPEIFRDAVLATAQQLGIPEIYMEKDYWVTVALEAIFRSELVGEAVFKGGTALSKCHRLIERFSEDIDIVVLRHDGETDNQLKNKIKKISQLVGEIVRKKILLDTEAIRQVVEEHSETVEVLNEYLKDEEDVLQAQTVPLLISMGSIKAERIEKIETEKTETEKTDTPVYKQEVIVSLNQTGLQLLELFRSNDLQLSAITINNFCRDNGVMKGALIDSVNEHLYELIDDVLIEETATGEYAVSAEYFQILVF